jgi:glycerol-3-phosphate cytidylyltransferase/D-beta-D-heptose 7-phosphate kinase/D-beta-D-heptose 1-phosphate adenosyltransferase
MKVVIVSGYFNPLHGGHLDMIEAAKGIGDRLIVIVNNDKQQLLKKGKIILDEDNRIRLISALKYVDDAVLAVDEDPPVIETLKLIAEMHPQHDLVFANGGDRDSTKVIPESEICQELGIEIVWGLGDKVDSSTRINRAMGHEES